MKCKKGDIVIYKSRGIDKQLGITDGDRATVLHASTDYATTVYVYFHKWQHEEPAYDRAHERVRRFGMPAYKLPLSNFNIEVRCMFDGEKP